jgi:hypothetical protein
MWLKTTARKSFDYVPTRFSVSLILPLWAGDIFGNARDSDVLASLHQGTFVAHAFHARLSNFLFGRLAVDVFVVGLRVVRVSRHKRVRPPNWWPFL